MVWYQPPGWVIPLVWFILFSLLAIARTQLLQLPQPRGEGWLWGLAFLCATYAYYTIGLAKWTGISALWFGLFGNLAVILFAALVVHRLLSISLTAALLTVPVILWTAYASLIVLGEMKLAKLM